MATEVNSGPLGELRAASTAGGGTALTTTATFIAIPDGARHLFLTPRNFATAVVAKIALNPYLFVMRTTDDLATATEVSQNAQDGSGATHVTLSSQGTAAQGDYLYVGSHQTFRGVNVTVDGANGNDSVLTVNYWNGSAWADTSATDGTISPAGKSLGATGNVSWTVPTAWAKATLAEIASPAPGSTVAHSATSLYWTRWEFSAALDSAVTLDAMLAMNRSTAYSEWISGQAMELRIRKGPHGIACVEALTDAGTANLVVNVASASDDYGIL